MQGEEGQAKAMGKGQGDGCSIVGAPEREHSLGLVLPSWVYLTCSCPHPCIHAQIHTYTFE